MLQFIDRHTQVFALAARPFLPAAGVAGFLLVFLQLQISVPTGS